jgi:hypothetical protein
MDTGFLTSVTSWSAYLSAFATILTLITGIQFFAVGTSFGKANDISSVFQVLFMIPLAMLLYRQLPSEIRTLGLISALIGIAGMLAAAYGQTLLVLEKIDFKASLNYFPAGVAIGIWLILTNAYALRSDLFHGGLAWTGILAGVSYIVLVLAFLIKGQPSMLFYLSSMVLAVSYPIWAIWLGYLISTGKIILG